MILFLRLDSIGLFMVCCESVTNINRMGMLKGISLALLFGKSKESIYSFFQKNCKYDLAKPSSFRE